MNPYDVLGVARDADFETLRGRYRQLVRENHPDLSSTKRECDLATARMSAINQAWAIVRDSQTRAEFDQTLRVDEANLALNCREAQPKSASVSRSNDKTDSRRPKRRSAHSPERQARQRVSQAATLFYDHGRVDEAIALCQLVLRGDFRSVPARELLGDIYAHRGETGRAQALWEQALLLAPTNPILTRKLQSLNRSSSVKTPRGLGREDLGGSFRTRTPASGAAPQTRLQPEQATVATALIDPMRALNRAPKVALWKRVLQRLAR